MRFINDLGTPDIAPDHRPNVDIGAYEFIGISCRADFNFDGMLDTRDFLAFLNAFNAQEWVADYNRDGTINTLDLGAFVNDISFGCP